MAYAPGQNARGKRSFVWSIVRLHGGKSYKSWMAGLPKCHTKPSGRDGDAPNNSAKVTSLHFTNNILTKERKHVPIQKENAK